VRADPSPAPPDEDISTEDTVLAAADTTDGYVSFTDSFKYLGSRVDYNLQDVHGACSRIKSASHAGTRGNTTSVPRSYVSD
jgi:hypothetical protein